MAIKLLIRVALCFITTGLVYASLNVFALNRNMTSSYLVMSKADLSQYPPLVCGLGSSLSLREGGALACGSFVAALKGRQKLG
jgi:hypothetical protein